MSIQNLLLFLDRHYIVHQYYKHDKQTEYSMRTGRTLYTFTCVSIPGEK